MDLELLKHAKGYIEKMANGINPLTGEKIPNNELINSVRISRCLFYVNDVLGEVLSNGGVKTVNLRKIPFNLTKEELKGFKISNEPMLVSDIVKTLNSLKTNPNMANLKASKITEWLVHLEILNVREINDRTYKLPSFTGEKMGLYIEERIGYRGEYFVVRYPKQMQEFIINNFDNLLEYIKR